MAGRYTVFDEAGDRAEALSIFNYQRIHRFAGIMSFALVALHIYAAVHHDPTYSFRVPGNLYLFIISHIVTSSDTSLTDW